MGWDAGRAIGDIVASDIILTKQNFATVKVGCCSVFLNGGSTYSLQILYAQKYFSSVLPRILDGAQSCSGESRNSTFGPI